MPGEVHALTDPALLRACAAGDSAACAAFVTRHDASLWRYVQALAGSDAEDVLQETFLAALRHADTFRGEGSARGWLYAIARNRLHREHRRRLSEPPSFVSLDELGERAGWGADVEGQAEAHEALARALDMLEPADRELILLRDLDGLSGAEVSALLDLPHAAVRSRLHRARLRLRATLRGHHGP